MSDQPHRRRAHASARDLERYASLFAERTTVMRSSAMRDLMAITARPEVISLAGGLPDTSTFPPQAFAARWGQVAPEQQRSGNGTQRLQACVREREIVQSVPERDDHDPEEPGKAHARIVRRPFVAATARSAGAAGAKASGDRSFRPGPRAARGCAAISCEPWS